MASRKKKAPATTGGEEFTNDAERSKADILAVATEEFATFGLSGARVDAIAKRTRTSKRMIYYYFKGKEGLYRAVLEKAYSEIRSIDSQVGIEDAEPVEAIRKIVEITFDYDETHPYFISLVAVENVHRGRNIAKLPSIKQSGASIIRVLTSIWNAAQSRGRVPRRCERDRPASFHQCVLRVSGVESFHVRKIFDCDLSDATVRAAQKIFLKRCCATSNKQ
jgi:AcrR family transcriptional regulator